MNTTRITMFAFTVTLAAMLLHAGSTNCPSQSGVGRSAYVAAHEWQRQRPAAAPPFVNEYAEQQQSDWNPGRNSVRLTNLMAHAALIVEARAVAYAAVKDYSSSNVYQPAVPEYDELTKVRIERIVASCWPEADTRQRLVCSNDALYLYVAGYTRGFSGMNAPVLLRDRRYLLWLVPFDVTDQHFTYLQSYAREPLSRSAIYKAYVGYKGTLQLDEKYVWLRTLIPADRMSDDEITEWDRKTDERRQEYLVNSFNTTNKSDIVQAVRHLARAMAPGSDKRAHLQRAKQYLNGAAHLSLDGLIEMERFRWTDVAVPEH